MRKKIILQIVLLLWGFLLIPATPASADASQTVVFICDHGNVKSLIAATLFNRQAELRHLPFHAIARGVTPAQGAVPQPVATGLRDDGYDVSGFEAKPIATADLQDAAKVVLLNVAPSSVPAADPRKTDVWAGIPAASTSYPQAREAIARRVEILLQQLAGHTHSESRP